MKTSTERQRGIAKAALHEGPVARAGGTFPGTPWQNPEKAHESKLKPASRGPTTGVHFMACAASVPVLASPLSQLLAAQPWRTHSFLACHWQHPIHKAAEDV